jgi:glycosyltransferase involved in cell wall biosynthesis
LTRTKGGASRALERLHIRRERRFDVLFYTPWIGDIVSGGRSLPPGGAEHQMLTLAKELVRRGLAVAVVVFGSATELPDEVDGVRIFARPPYRKPDSAARKLAEAVRIWQALWRVSSRTIVYRGIGFELALLVAYARFARRRVIYSSANVADFNAGLVLGSRAAVLMFEFGARRADAIVVQTPEQVELCRKTFRRTPTLIRSLAQVPAYEPHVPEAFLWVGRSAAYKRPLEYVALARAVPEARFWMITVPRSSLDRALAERVAVESADVPNLELLPSRPREEVAELMSRAVASVNTADFEGMPNVLLEAWSRGVPALVLTHDPGGVVGAHGLGGFADGCFEKLVALAREQWSSRGDRDEVSRRCLAYVKRHHAAATIASQWMSIIAGEGSVVDRAALE